MKFWEVLANGEDDHAEELIATVQGVAPTLQETIRSTSVTLTLIVTAVLILLIILSALIKHKSEAIKVILFVAIAVVVLINTAYLVGSTIYINRQSVTGGPVHWHADFEIFSCGRQIDLANPSGLSNYIGNPVVHEHGDKKIHIEGALLHPSQASLNYFFSSLGGRIGKNSLTVPTNEGLKTIRNGDFCPDGSTGRWSAFVYKTSLPSDDGKVENGTFRQEKLEDPAKYIVTPSVHVPPGDCIILEFGPEDQLTTEKMCISYQVAKELNKIHD